MEARSTNESHEEFKTQKNEEIQNLAYETTNEKIEPQTVNVESPEKEKLKDKIENSPHHSPQSNDSQNQKPEPQVIQNQNQLRKVGLPNVGNTCFVNAVIQCLFYTKDFLSELRGVMDGDNKLIVKLSLILRWIKGENGYTEEDELRKTLKEFILELSKINKKLQPGQFGDPNTLFRALFAQFPKFITSGYTGTIERRYICFECIPDDSYFHTENIYLTQDILPSFDVNRNFYNSAHLCNLFQNKFDRLYCKRCQNETEHTICTYFLEPPNILVINLEDDLNNDNCEKPQDLLQNIRLRHKQKGFFIEYIFFAGVATTHRGKNGVHAVSIIKDQEQIYIYDDDKDVKCINIDQLGHYPRLLFYVNKAMIS